MSANKAAETLSHRFEIDAAKFTLPVNCTALIDLKSSSTVSVVHGNFFAFLDDVVGQLIRFLSLSIYCVADQVRLRLSSLRFGQEFRPFIEQSHHDQENVLFQPPSCCPR